MKWISVKDKLPEDSQEVLVFSDGDFYLANFYIEYMWNDETQSMDNYWSLMPYNSSPAVTHWMPLSKPPMED